MAKKVGCSVGQKRTNGRCVKLPYVRIRQMESSGGRKVPNQFVVATKDATYFQSYGTIISVRKNGKTYLDRHYWNYSVTTGKYRNQFLGETKRETQKKIKTGEYILTDLNK